MKDNQFEEEIEIIAEEFETEHDLKVLNECWHISIRPKIIFPSVFPQDQINFLETIGKIENIKILSDEIPQLKEFDPEKCYLGFEIDLKCNKKKNEIESNFNSIRDKYKVRILPPNSSISDYMELIDELSESNMRIGEILKEIGSLTDFELEEVLSIQKELLSEKDNQKSQKPIGEILLQEKMIQESVLNAALQKQAKVRNK